jgi:hypothetical protein
LLFRGQVLSNLIKQCMIYAQATAAYKGGFYTDPTGNFEHAGAEHGKMGGAYLDKAERALEKLAASSRKKRPITTAELLAEAKVMKLLMKTEARTNPEPEEADFVHRFTNDVAHYLEQELKNCTEG